MVATSGQTVVNTKALGLIIRCTAKESSRGAMGGSIRDSTGMTRSTDTVSLSGLMAGNTMATGLMGSKKDLESTIMRKARCGTVCGRMGNG